MGTEGPKIVNLPDSVTVRIAGDEKEEPRPNLPQRLKVVVEAMMSGVVELPTTPGLPKRFSMTGDHRVIIPLNVQTWDANGGLVESHESWAAVGDWFTVDVFMSLVEQISNDDFALLVANKVLQDSRKKRL